MSPNINQDRPIPSDISGAQNGTDAGTRTTSVSSLGSDPPPEEYMLSLYFSDKTGDKPNVNRLSQLRDCIKYEIFTKLKFLPHEGKSLQMQEIMKNKYPSFTLPDLNRTTGAPYTILKSMGLYKEGKTLEDRVTYWKTYRKTIKNMILTERSSRTQAMKACVVNGELRVVLFARVFVVCLLFVMCMQFG